MDRKAGNDMKYRITAVRIAGHTPDPLDQVARTYNKVHFVTYRDQYRANRINEVLKEFLSGTVPNVVSKVSKHLNEAVERIKSFDKGVKE